MLATLAVVLVSALVVWRMTRPERVARLAADYLAKITGAHVEVNQAHLHLDGAVEILGVQISLPADAGLDLDPAGGLPDEAARLIHVRQVILRHSWMSLLGGRFEPQTLVFTEPTIYLTEDPRDGAFLYERLLAHQRAGAASSAPASGGSAGQAQRPATLPEVTVRQGRIAFGVVQDGTYRLRAEKQINGQLKGETSYDSTYRFRLRIEDAALLQQPGVEPIVLSGQINLERLTLDAEIPAFAFDSTQGAYLPAAIRQWWRQLEPDGRVKSVRFGYDPDPNVRWHAQLELVDVELGLPLDLATETGQARLTRMKDVSGIISFRNRELTTDITGEVDGPGFEFQYEVSGSMSIMEPDQRLLDAPFAFEVIIGGRIPGQQKLAWPPLLSRLEQFFERFKPSGELFAHVRAHREQPGANPVLRGEVELRDAAVEYFKFPYPLEHVQGRFRFTENELRIVSIQGQGPTGARVSVTGEVAPLTREAAVALTITGHDVPMDEYLYLSLPEHRQSAVAEYVDHEAYQTLVARGAINRPNDSTGEAPTFELGGKVSLVTSVVRNPGDYQPYHVTTSVDLAGANVLCRAWPYPIHIASGRIIFKPGEVVCDELALEGLTGARGVLDGHLQWPLHVIDNRRDVSIEVAIEDLPLDRLLLASLSARDAGWSLRYPDRELAPDGWLTRMEKTGAGDKASIDDWLMRIVAPPVAAVKPGAEHMHAAGRFNAKALLDRAESGDIQFGIDAVLAEGWIEPFGGTARITPLSGKLRITGDGAAFERLDGRYLGGDVTFSGQIGWDGRERDLALHVAARGLPIAQRVIDVVPTSDPFAQQARDLIDRYQLQGRFDAKLDVIREHDDEIDLSLEVMPLEVRAVVNDQPVALTDMTGRVHVEQGGLTLNQLTARFGDETVNGRALVGGWVRPGQADESVPASAEGRSIATELTLDVRADRVDETARVLLPAAVAQAIDALEVDGRYHAMVDRLMLGGVGGPPSEGQSAAQLDVPLEMALEARVELLDATAQVGVAVTELEGMLTVKATRQEADGPLGLTLTLDATRLRAAERLLEPLTVTLTTAKDDPSRLDLTKLEGRLYGGQLTGTGFVTIGQTPTFDLDLMLDRVSIEALLDPMSIEAQPGPQVPVAATPGSGSEQTPTVVTDPVEAGRGRLAARLTVNGQAGDAASRRGRGELRIDEARMYELPVTLTMLQLLNITMPRSTSFDQASARFLILGDEIQFDQIRIEAPSIAFMGEGVMHYPTREIDLEFVTRNPSGHRFGALSELGAMFKDQLIRLQVTGTIDDPKTRVRPLSGVEKTLKGLFQAEPDNTQSPPGKSGQ